MNAEDAAALARQELQRRAAADDEANERGIWADSPVELREIERCGTTFDVADQRREGVVPAVGDCIKLFSGVDPPSDGIDHQSRRIAGVRWRESDAVVRCPQTRGSASQPCRGLTEPAADALELSGSPNRMVRGDLFAGVQDAAGSVDQPHRASNRPARATERLNPRLPLLATQRVRPQSGPTRRFGAFSKASLRL